LPHGLPSLRQSSWQQLPLKVGANWSHPNRIGLGEIFLIALADSFHIWWHHHPILAIAAVIEIYLTPVLIKLVPYL
jgi:hypothetical protein